MAILMSEGNAFRVEPFSEQEYLTRGGENLIVFETEDGQFWMGNENVSATVIPKMMREAYNQPIAEDPDEADWSSTVRKETEDSPKKRKEYRDTVRWLCKWNPNVQRALRLYMNYVIGPRLQLEIDLADDGDEMTEEDENFCESVVNLWCGFLRANRRAYSLKEHAKRAWRDGEAFLWLLPDNLWKRPWPPRVVLLRPEEIGGPDEGVDDDNEDFGIVTDENDVFSVIEYKRVSVVSTSSRTVGQELPPIPAEQVIHTKIDSDSDEKRGNSRFLACVKPARQILSMLETEITGRKIQSSMVIQRKVSGGPNNVRGLADAAKTSTTNYTGGAVAREKIRPGSIITTSPSVEIEFLTPDMNFSDASPLARQILLQVVAATGWPEYMVTGDASQGNLSSTLSQEGPVVKMVEDEQQFFADEFEDLFDWFFERAIDAGQVGGYSSVDEFRQKFRLVWTFPNPVTRDDLKQSQADNLGLMNGSLSRHQAIRNRGLKPARVLREIEKEMEELPAMGNGLAAMNPNMADKSASSQANAQDGSGANQGGDPVIQHDDNSGAGS